MSSPYIGEIRMFAGSFAPAGWALCQGQLMPISENDALFNLIGTTYGGDGQETFAVPNLCGRIPVHMGTGPGLSTRQIGELGGVESVTLTTNQIPQHNHALLATGANAASADAAGKVLAQVPSYTPYVVSSPSAPLAATSIGTAGGSQPHENMQPYLCVSFIISLFGIFPSQT